MKKFFPFLSVLKKTFAYGDRLRPTRDWFVLLAAAGVLLLASMAWNVFLFNELQNGKALGTTSAQVSKPSTPSVVHAQDIFKQRASEEGNYQTLYHFVDPSLPSS